MDILKQVFPIAFKSADKNEFISSLIIHVILLIVGSALIGLIALLDVAIINWLFGVLGTVLDLYCLGGIVISILIFLKVMQA